MGSRLRLIALLALIPVAAFADKSAVSSQVAGGVMEVNGRFEVSAPIHQVWLVLTDYAHLPDFVSGLSQSRILTRSGNDVNVVQVGAAKVLFVHVSAHLELAIHEIPEQEIQFHDVALKDFEKYEGTWTLKFEKGQTQVIYTLHAKPRTAAPDFLGVRALSSGAADLLDAVRKEIIRRSALVTPLEPKP